MPLSKKEIIKLLLPNLHVEPKLRPSQFIQKYWSAFEQQFGTANVGINGIVFEELIAITLIRAKIFPFYLQAKVAFIPSVNYDLLVYSQDFGPIVLSAKTSLRERWKQADLEAVALRYIYRQSKSYIISLNEKEVVTRKKDMKSVMALDGFILATTPEYDDLLIKLSTVLPQEAPTVKTVESSFFITDKNYPQRYS